MNLNVEVAQLRALLQRIADHHRQDADEPRLCAAGCPGRWPCDTRQLVDWGEVHPVDHPLTVASYPQASNEDAPCAPHITPQRPEQAELVHGDTPGRSGGSEAVGYRTGHGLALEVAGGTGGVRWQGSGRCVCGERWPHDTPDSVGTQPRHRAVSGTGGQMIPTRCICGDSWPHATPDVSTGGAGANW